MAAGRCAFTIVFPHAHGWAGGILMPNWGDTTPPCRGVLPIQGGGTRPAERGDGDDEAKAGTRMAS